MPFIGDTYTRIKTFVNGGDLFPIDLNQIQDDLGTEIASMLPEIGDLKTMALTSSSGNWLLCNGSALTTAMNKPSLRTALVAAGNPYGVSGSDPLLPNFVGRVMVGANGTYPLGNAHGAESHGHIFNTPSHTHWSPGVDHAHEMPLATTSAESASATIAEPGAGTFNVARGNHTHTEGGYATEVADRALGSTTDGGNGAAGVTDNVSNRQPGVSVNVYVYAGAA